jgi:hypothetical protein
MGVFFRPRRPLVRLAAGATTAAVAYNVGQRRAEQAQVNEQAQAAYAATRTEPEPVRSEPEPIRTDADPVGELERLARLHESGALSDTEFAAAQSRLLG